MVSSAPPSHPVADASLPDSSYRTKRDDGDVQIEVPYMLVVGGGGTGEAGGSREKDLWTEEDRDRVSA